jgi:hypothetical protein
MSSRINRSVDGQRGSYFTAGSPPECPAQERRRDSANGQHLQVDIDLLGGLGASGDNLRESAQSPRCPYSPSCRELTFSESRSQVIERLCIGARKHRIFRPMNVLLLYYILGGGCIYTSSTARSAPVEYP